MFKTIANAWKMPDIRKKILFTLLMLLIYRIGVFIPVPGVNVDFIATQVESYDVLGFLNLFSGGALGNMTIFALGIVPYINASIIMNLLTVAIPRLERLAKEGDDGRKKICLLYTSRAGLCSSWRAFRKRRRVRHSPVRRISFQSSASLLSSS